jgi:hypothetical protein
VIFQIEYNRDQLPTIVYYILGRRIQVRSFWSIEEAEQYLAYIKGRSAWREAACKETA